MFYRVRVNIQPMLIVMKADASKEDVAAVEHRIRELGFTPNEYIEELRTADLSVGTYAIPAGGVDEQSPHA